MKTINLMPVQRPRFKQAPQTLPINDALQIKAAEYWLKLGEADLALRELEALPTRTWKCGWALKVRIAAMGVLRERDEMTVQA
jgi:hypothetical protein